MDNKAKTKSGPAVTPLSGLNKRQQVARANSMIFIWVASSAAVIALSLVALQFLVKQALFNQEIIKEKASTNKILESNITNAAELKKNIDKLVADNNLESARANDDDSNLQVILDALPTTGDTTTLSNSLYTQIIGPAGVKVESVSAGTSTAELAAVAPASPVAPGAQADPTAAPAAQPLPFTVTTLGDAKQTKQVFENLERTIRPINPQIVIIRATEGRLTTTINGETFYLSASSIDLGKKSVTP